MKTVISAGRERLKHTLPMFASLKIEAIVKALARIRCIRRAATGGQLGGR
jgi:hypothetical protein